MEQKKTTNLGKRAKMVTDGMMKGSRASRGDVTEYSRKESERGKKK